MIQRYKKYAMILPQLSLLQSTPAKPKFETRGRGKSDPKSLYTLIRRVPITRQRLEEAVPRIGPVNIEHVKVRAYWSGGQRKQKKILSLRCRVYIAMDPE